MRIARFLVTPELLRQLFHLPLGTDIVWAGMDHQHIELTVTHPDLHDVEVVEAEHPPLIRPTFHREADVVLLVDWGQEC